jgi:signal transduction histidine kinase
MAEVAGPRRLRQLLDAVLVVGSDLDLHSVLRRIVESATQLVDARYGALGVLDEAGARLADFITVGIDDVTHAAIGELPKGNGILGVLIADARPLRLPELSEHPATFGFPPNHPPMHSFLGLPVRVGDRIFGNLYLTDKISAEAFTDVDEELVVGLAAAAGIAIEKARLHDQLQGLVLVQDRERIARDLHDSVIQRVFGVGLQLQSTSRLVRVDPDAAVERIETAIDELDLTVKHIRSAIFGLEDRPTGGVMAFRSRVLELARESAATLGFEPMVLFDGPVDARVNGQVANELAAVITEALSNVARHAHAKRAEVHVLVGDDIVVRIEDDGVGPPPRGAPRGNGLDNMATRAARLGGAFDIRARADGGTVVEWSVPFESG